MRPAGSSRNTGVTIVSLPIFLGRAAPIAVAMLCACMAACGALPPPGRSGRIPAFLQPTTTELGRLSGRAAALHGGLSGVRILDSGIDGSTNGLH